MRRPFPILLAVTFATIPARASACAVCMGDPNSYLADATNSTIWILLGLVGFIFVATGLTALFLWYHARTPLPPHVQLVENLTTEPEEC